eukprot:408187-Pelagomonas_calceolata.AAC.2
MDVPRQGWCSSHNFCAGVARLWGKLHSFLVHSVHLLLPSQASTTVLNLSEGSMYDVCDRCTEELHCLALV